MAKVLSKTLLYIGQGDPDTTTPAADTFDRVGNLITTTGPEFQKDDIEHTDMDSTLKEFFGDLANPGNFNFTANRNFGDAGQTSARTLVQGQSQKNIRIERLDPSDDSVLETVDLRGEVMEWSEEASQGAPFQITGRIKISGAVTFS
jgi:hypothetical protein